jgi:hypothetical protein
VEYLSSHLEILLSIFLVSTFYISLYPRHSPLNFVTSLGQNTIRVANFPGLVYHHHVELESHLRFTPSSSEYTITTLVVIRERNNNHYPQS